MSLSSGLQGLGGGLQGLSGASKSTFNPLSLSPSLYLDASNSSSLFQDTSGTTPASANNAPVGRWNDLSGNGNNVTQGTANAKPLLKTSIQNGNNVVRFDGVNDLLDGGNILPLTGNYSIYAVLITSDVSGAIVSHVDVISPFTGWNASIGLLPANSGKLQSFSSGSAAYVEATGAAINDGSAHLIEITRSSAVLSFTIDGAARGNFAQANNGASSITLTVGSDSSGLFYLAADIGTLLIFNRALTVAEQALLRSSLKTKWGTP